MTESVEERFSYYRERVNRALLQHLPDKDHTVTTLEAAMHYATMNGGKRVRPTLVYATGKAFNASLDTLDVPACAIEFMHAYSLVHDDLPSMDDDDLRRGNPTCHIAYDEATAILAGDALQALAFTTLAIPLRDKLDAGTVIDMIEELGRASGVGGMAAGQAIDLQSVGQQLDLEQLESMHRCKTGALIRASVVLGAICGKVKDQQVLENLRVYGDAIGLSFQIVDDILDVIGDTAVLGKTQGADIALHKPTFPSIMGIDGARQHAHEQRERALAALDGYGKEFDELRELASFIVSRSN